MKRKRRRLSKKKVDQLEREEAEKESKARSESEKRQERIKVLWQELQSGHLAKETDKELAETEFVRSLVELVHLQKREINYLTQFRRDWEEIHAYYPKQLENLSTASFRAEWQPLLDKLLAEQKPKEVWEYKRRVYKLPGGVGLIEYEFGGVGEAERQKQTLSGLSGLAYQPTCLNHIFAGGAVKMHDIEGKMLFSLWRLPGKPGLQSLFGLHRNRFKNLPTPPYDFRAVTKIMEALLREELPNRKTPARGARRRLWPRVDLRERVLSGIAVRINSLAISREIAREFLNVVRPYLPDSAKK